MKYNELEKRVKELERNFEGLNQFFIDKTIIELENDNKEENYKKNFEYLYYKYASYCLLVFLATFLLLMPFIIIIIKLIM